MNAPDESVTVLRQSSPGGSKSDDLPTDGGVVLYVTSGGELSDLGANLDTAIDDRLSDAIEMTGFTGEFGEALSLPARYCSVCLDRL